MEEEILNDSLPYLKELENKVGRKTPQSLLIWIKDAADCEDGCRSDGERESSFAFNDNFADKIRTLRQEMAWLRSADVRILRQLVAVHEGIEAMRWLMEERDGLPSQSSSLTGSLSSLVAMDGHGPSMSPCRESPSQTQDLAETTSKESEDRHPQADHHDLNHDSYFDVQNAESVEPAPLPPPLNPKFGSNNFIHDDHSQATPSPENCLLNSAKPKRSKSQRGDIDLLQGVGTHSTIKRALLRSSRARRDMKAENIFSPIKYSDQAEREQKTQESFRGSNSVEKEESTFNQETVLLGYDAQWCWVESQDDVTFL